MRLRAAALLLDNDGTLVLSQPAVDRAWGRWAERVGLDPTTISELVHGRRAVESIAVLAPDRDLAEEDAWLEQVELSEMQDVEAVAGAADLLGSLPDARWAVATSASTRLAIARLDAAGLPRPSVVIGADIVERGKPDPEPYLTAAAALGVDPARCVVLEDSTAGVRAGVAAGATVIGVLTGTAEDRLRAAGAVATVDDLTAVRASARVDGELDVVVSTGSGPQRPQ
ncbi:MAG: HAD-IA family hydrolase [Actinomycetota bacterium]